MTWVYKVSVPDEQSAGFIDLIVKLDLLDELVVLKEGKE